MADHQLDLLKLFCVLYAKDSDFVPFSIGIEPSKTIANLKGAVEPKVYSTLKRMGVDATQLKLYRVKIRNEEFEGVNIKPLLSGRMSPDTELEASKELSHYFNSQTPPEGGCIHIIAEAPEGLSPLDEDLIKFHLFRLSFYDSPDDWELTQNGIRITTQTMFERSLGRKRTVLKETQEMKQIRGHLGDKFDLFFQSDVDQTVSLDPLDLVHGPESIHYDSLFTSKSLVDASLPKDARESHISAFLSNLVAHVDATAEMKLHFRSKWPFPILVHLREDRKIVSDTPQSTILLQVENFPQMILDVAGDEDEDEGTRKRMLLQAVGLARLGNALRAPESKEPFVVTAIYIHKNFSATRHIVYQPIINREHVLYTEAKFNLRDPLSAFEFVFQLYNLVGQVRSQGRSLSNVDTRMKNTVDEIRCHYDPTMTEYRQKSPGESEEGEEGSRKRKVPKKRDEDDMSEDEMEDIIEDAGFTIRTDVIKEKWGTMRVMPLPKKVRRARTPEGKRVIVKFTQDDTGEVAILKYLKRVGGPDHHIIDLLDALPQHVGYLIVLPRCTPLRDVLSVSYSPSSVRMIQTQFLEGIAFMHQHGVAHLDIKPDNIMVDRKYIPFKVSIIDFDVSMKVKDVETTTEGMVGTRGWIAPEVAKGGRYSPILADRWACGKMLLYFGEHAKLTVEMEELCYGLMSMDPTARPPLPRGNVQTVLEEQSDEDSREEQSDEDSE